MLERRPDLFAAAAPIVSWTPLSEKTRSRKTASEKDPHLGHLQFGRPRHRFCQERIQAHQRRRLQRLQDRVRRLRASRLDPGHAARRTFSVGSSPAPRTTIDSMSPKPRRPRPKKIGIFADVTDGDMKKEPTRAVRPVFSGETDEQSRAKRRPYVPPEVTFECPPPLRAKRRARWSWKAVPPCPRLARCKPGAWCIAGCPSSSLRQLRKNRQRHRYRWHLSKLYGRGARWRATRANSVARQHQRDRSAAVAFLPRHLAPQHLYRCDEREFRQCVLRQRVDLHDRRTARRRLRPSTICAWNWSSVIWPGEASKSARGG